MKIPISTSYRQLKSITASLSSRLLIAIDGFRSNILNNRDAHKVHQPTIRSITVVPYESSAKAVDTIVLLTQLMLPLLKVNSILMNIITTPQIQIKSNILSFIPCVPSYLL